eukprot:gnl/TRDRNA2_/TRDRNA2_31022_c0_seq1.p1 gnl/TRDRNA2_/TRDRNA2_31022_c0~~gnl/TRDRNA2_/TRDRNA2_31022_c0_seq1.p1  ORF type:complete len:295 (-),score=14.20 gnl/TRDRNA2_/TRDRNA2_31022_c0_seq1:129-1013(-)
MSRDTWLVGDSPWNPDTHMRRQVTFGQAPDSLRRLPWPPRPGTNGSRSPFTLHATKGDRSWMSRGLPTPPVACQCAQCGSTFAGNLSAGPCNYCPSCYEREDTSHVGHDARWRATLHTDEPRHVPNPGKVAERQQCRHCGALEPHVCRAIPGTPVFDSPEDRRRVGFVDRGVRRHRVYPANAAGDLAGFTAAGAGGDDVAEARKRPRSPKTPWVPPRRATPFSSQTPSSTYSRALSAPAAGAPAVSIAEAASIAAKQDVGMATATLDTGPGLRDRRYELRRSAFLASRAGTAAG